MKTNIIDSHSLSAALHSKYQDISEYLSRYDKLLILFSGGVDSSLLLHIAHASLTQCPVSSDGLRRHLKVCIGVSPSLAHRELEDARSICNKLDISLKEIPTSEFSNSNYLENTSSRCYHCKDALLSSILEYVAKESDSSWSICDGLLYDDVIDDRPGVKACTEYGVLHPLRETHFRKEDVRALAHAMGLPFAEKEATPCLSSRVVRGTKINHEYLLMIEKAEKLLRDNGFTSHRVRLHGLEGSSEVLARIELDESEESLSGTSWDSLGVIKNDILACGFSHVALDLFPYRSGGANSGVVKIKKTK